MWILIVILALVPIAWLIAVYNRLVRQRNLVSEAWSGIDVQLKRRYDVIPNIVQTVKGYAEHEKKLLEEITELRTKNIRIAPVPERARAETLLTGMLKRLFAVVEAYPDLKANQNFLDLQETLTEIEDEIQLARRYYNGTVRDFNNVIESFPSLIVARVAGFRQADFFEIEVATQRAVPEVGLGDS